MVSALEERAMGRARSVLACFGQWGRIERFNDLMLEQIDHITRSSLEPLPSLINRARGDQR